MTDGTDGSLQTSDGRTLAYMSVGPADGPLILHQHGGPGSRLEAMLLADIAHSVGVRIVVLDRPGMGRSTAQRSRSYAGWADDLQVAATALGADVFAVTGVSEGGPWALAAAYYIPEARLANATCMAGGCYGTFGANWAAQYLSKADALGGRLAMQFRPGFAAMYAILGVTVTKFPKQYAKTIMKSVSASDRLVLERPGAMDMFVQDSAECFRAGSSGLVIDAELLYRQWEFDVTKIVRPVRFWQGLADTLVPPVINQTVAERTPGAIWHPVEGEGHLLSFVHPEIFQQAKDDIQAAKSA